MEVRSEEVGKGEIVVVEEERVPKEGKTEVYV